MRPGLLKASVSDPAQIVQENVTLHYTLLTSGSFVLPTKAFTGSDQSTHALEGLGSVHRQYRVKTSDNKSRTSTVAYAQHGAARQEQTCHTLTVGEQHGTLLVVEPAHT